MSTRLSKIARELNLKISVIVEFLNANGYNYDENPNERIEKDVISFIKNNIPAYLVDKNKSSNIPVKQTSGKSSPSQTSGEIPLELKIIDAAGKEKKLIERIIGFADFNWHYTVAKFEGTCSQPVDFTLFDEVICELLLTEKMSFTRIGNLLGLDIQTDPAEREILFSAITQLKRDEMIDNDEGLYWLTDLGKDYAKNGVKFVTFTREFDLYIDAIGDIQEKAKEIFSSLKSEKQRSFKRENLPKNIVDVKPLAEVQAPEIHFPKKNFFLQSCTPLSAEGYIAKVWIVLLENFRDHTIRPLVYDEKQDKIIIPLSEAFDKLEDEKLKLLEKLVKVGQEEDLEVEFTQEEKKQEQIAIEKELIQKHQELESAVKVQDIEKVKEIEKQVSVMKQHFNSLEFEVELKRLFDETANDLWIMSPWIKRGAALRRIPFFEKYLKKGGRIFIAYSEPEKTNAPMADEDAMHQLMELEEKYQNFYLHQLPVFHYKRVWLRTDNETNLYYTGSYNILSFFVNQGQQKVRQEEMTKLPWDEEKETVYQEVLQLFSRKYLDMAIKNFNRLCENVPEKIDKTFLQKLRTIGAGKLKPFINQQIDGFDEKYKKLQEEKNKKLDQYQELFFQREIKNFREDLSQSTNQRITLKEKRSIQARFYALQEELIDYNGKEIKELEEEIRKLKVSDSNSRVNRPTPLKVIKKNKR